MRYLVILCTLALCAALQAAPTTYTLNTKRVNEIAGWLSPKPEGPFKPVDDRVFWKAIADEPGYNGLIKLAVKLKDKDIDPIPDELYLEFSRNGNRKNYETAAFARRRLLAPLVMAECMENKGDYLPAITNLITHFNKERTWVLPAHDKQLTNFNQTLVTIDLFSSDLAWQLAITDYLLGAKLDPAVRAELRTKLNYHIVQPYGDMIHHRRKLDSWLLNTNNWNAVCHNNVLGCVLHLVDDPLVRAQCITAAEHYSRYFLEGFTPDGYCSEGVGYWNYGYGRYAQMAMNVRFATKGKVDFFRLPGAGRPATYGPQIEVAGGISPSFADCSLRAEPTHALLWLLNRVYGWENAAYKDLAPGSTVGSLGDITSYYIGFNDTTPPIPGNPLPQTGSTRTVFEDAGVFILRQSKPESGLAVAFKGGNNAEHHNHNDIGSYLVVYKGEAPLLDPGAETYTARTFSKDRYVSRLLNSYGHAVPVIAGKLQSTGKKARARVVKKDFSSTTDTLVIDYKSAYDVPELKKLTRTFEYGRTANGMFVVTDEVEFSTPQTMETALVSLGEYTVNPDGSVAVSGKNSRLNVQIDSTAPFSTKTESIVENAPAKPNRLAITLKEKTSKATIRMVVTPGN